MAHEDLCKWNRRMNTSCRVATVAVLIGLLGAIPSAAQDTTKPGKISLTRLAPDLTPVADYTGPILERATLSGDWWGSRTNLYEHGITLDAALTQVFQGVATGGNDTNDTTYTGLLDTGLTLDTGKLQWWSGGLFVFNAQTGFADSFPLGAGTVSPPNFTALYPTPDKPDAFLMEYYLMQALSKEIVVIVGRVNAVNFLDRNRFANDPRNQFLNIALNNDPLFGAFVSFSTYGVLVSWQVTKHFSISPAVFDPNIQPGEWGAPPGGLFRDVGVGAEASLTWELAQDLGGAVRVDSIYVSKDTVALDNPRLPVELLLGLPLETKQGNWIVALNVEQYLWKPSASGGKQTVRNASLDFQEPGLGVFARFSYTPDDRNAWNIFASAGVGGRGLIPGRLYDRLGFGFYWLKESGALDNQPGNLLRDEWGLEAFYNVALTPWVQLTFDVQWARSGVTSRGNSVVLGGRLFTRF